MRADGREASELRPLHASFGELDRADGSGRFAFGPTAALASFAGPIEVRLRDELVGRATLELVHRPLEGVGGVPSRALEETLESVFQPLLRLNAFPRALVQIVVQSLAPQPALPPSEFDPEASKQTSWPKEADEDEEMDGLRARRRRDAAPATGYTLSSRAAAINSAALAALHAGSVPLRAVPLALAAAVVDGEILLDPSAEEEAAASARFGFGWAFGSGIATEGGEAELVWSHGEGSFSRDEFARARDAAREAAGQILTSVREEMGDFFAKRP